MTNLSASASNQEKLAYQAPALTVVGTFESITQAASTGNATDIAFASNTPISDLTFS